PNLFKTMKYLISLFAIFLILSDVFSQAKGNARYERQYNSRSSSREVNTIRRSSNGYSQTSSSTSTISVNGTDPFFVNDSTMILEVNAMMNVKADAFMAQLSITQAGGTLEETYQLMQNRISAFMKGLSTNFDTSSIYVDFISLVPTYDYVVDKKLFSRTANEVPSGYKLVKTLHIPYRTNPQLDQIMRAAAKGEIYDLVKVDYVVQDIQGVYDSLARVSSRLLETKQNRCKALGIELDSAQISLLAEDVSSTYPLERYKSYTAFSSAALPAQVKQGDVTKVKKNKAYYYDKINYNDFDVVINPVITEPVIQFMYSMSIRYEFGR
ncbi:MAG: hypothetical protein AAGI38_21195, partial [Bacteroidota bacterium]